MQIGFHKLKQKVNVLVVIGSDSIVQFYDVWMIQLFEDFDLAIRPLCVSCVLKRIEYLLKGEDSFGLFLLYLPNMSIST